MLRALQVPAFAVAIAVFGGAPWLDQRLVWCGWVAAAAALLVVDRLRGWWPEGWAVVSATVTMGIAFHWTPKVLAYAMATTFDIGLAIATPIVVWDALRLVLPLLIAARITSDPLRAWLPAGLAAVVLEAVTPAVFPWKLGYSQIAWPWLVQSADLFGPEFTTLVLYAHAGVIAWLVRSAVMPRGRTERVLMPPPPIVIALALCAANDLYGVWSMVHWGRVSRDAPHVSIALVQANPEEDGGIDALRSLTITSCSGRQDAPDLVCWPECSGGCYDERLESFADPEKVVDMSRPPNAGMRPLDAPPCPILFGGKFYAGHPDKPRALYQSGILVDADHSIAGRYHKRHLMPFGEFVPGEDWFPDIERYFPMQDEFTAGTQPTVLSTAGIRYGVMLCYEDMVSSAARSLVAEGATVLVSLINGAAFTEPLTLRQHRLLSQLRAVECRRPLLRCAATGETCIITPMGTIAAALPVHQRGVLEARVPALGHRTLYSITGRIFPWIAGCLLVWMIVPGWGVRSWSRRAWPAQQPPRGTSADGRR